MKIIASKSSCRRRRPSAPCVSWYGFDDFGSGKAGTSLNSISPSRSEPTFAGAAPPFSVDRAVRTPYRHDTFQPRYLVSESLDRTIEEVLALTPERLLTL